MTVTHLILQLQKNSTKNFSPEYYFTRGVFFKLLLSDELFLNYYQKRTIAFASYPLSCQISANSDSLGGRKRTRLRVFQDISKTVDLRAKTCKTDPYWNNFLVKKYFWHFYLTSKLSECRSFWVQNTNGHGGLSFQARSFKLWNFFIIFEDVLMTLYQLFPISYSYRDSENQCQCSVNTWSLSLNKLGYHI